MSHVLMSTSWTWNLGEPDDLGEVTLTLLRRRSDWGLSRAATRRGMLAYAASLAWRAGAYDAVVLSTVGVEAALTALLIKVRSRSTRVVVFDFLAPRRELPRSLASLLFRGIDRFLVIRSGDVAMLARRFGVPRERCVFVPWPVRADQVPADVGEDGYVYSAGWAHRDWRTLVAALDEQRLVAKIAPGRDVDVPERSRGRVEVVEMPPPEVGRSLAARASVVAVVMEETDLPAGPLVLLDAMAAGKAVVATAVNGTRDYVRDGETALVVPPGDAAALGAALTRLIADAELRSSLGRAARAEVLERCSLERFWGEVAAQCR
ncbi:glycosyltransferase [Georgenia sp. M64]|uniref:glycosyltransferase n=1 Tax=Georgenia sp. M64 TaxID=3120520 RepID=UPI0030E203A2